MGGLDRLFGNRLGLGERFEAGFKLLGPTALSMAGILCLTPALSSLIGAAAAPACAALGFDPAVLAGVLAIDMGGYPLAMELADDPLVGRYAGILVAATLGCTVTFTLPVGMGALAAADRTPFARGMLYGLVSLPAGLAAGGLLCGLDAAALAWQSLPVLALSALLLAGLRFAPGATLRGFSIFASAIRAATTLGLTAGAFRLAGGNLHPRPRAGRGRHGGRRVDRRGDAGQPPRGGTAPARAQAPARAAGRAHRHERSRARRG